jgi:hypothetical protein
MTDADLDETEREGLEVPFPTGGRYRLTPYERSACTP